MDKTRRFESDLGDDIKDDTIDLLALLRRHGFLLAIAICVGAGIGIGVSLLMPLQWEAAGMIEIGQDGTAPTGEASWLEPPVRVAQRINLGAFKAAVVTSLQLAPQSREARLVQESLRARHEPGDIVSVRVRAETPERAVQALDAVMTKLRATHDRLSLRAIDRLKSQLALVSTDIMQIQAQREALERGTASAEIAGTVEDRFAEMVLSTNLLSTYAADLRNLKERKLQLEATLSIPQQFKTRLIEKPYLGDKPAWPRRSLFAAAGAIVGLGLAGLTTVYRRRG